jgi:hypothetical protein
MHQHEVERRDDQHHRHELGEPAGDPENDRKAATAFRVQRDFAHPIDTVPKVSCTPIAVVITFFSFLSMKLG